MARRTTIVILSAWLMIPGAVSHAASCDPADFTPGGARFTHGPIASAVRGLSARVGFRTDAEACVQIKYASNPELLQAVTSDAVLTEAADDFTGNIRVDSLTPATTYHYTIVVNGVDTAFDSSPRFKTFPPAGDPVSFTFGVLTDLVKVHTAPATATLAEEEPDDAVNIAIRHRLRGHRGDPGWRAL